jgi:hypothetical protein
MKPIIGLVIVFLFVGRPMARWLWRKVKGNELYYYILGFLAIVAMLCLCSLYSEADAQTSLSAYSTPIVVRHIPKDSNALAWTVCDTVANVPGIIIDSASWGTPETLYILTHERRHVTQGERFKGGCKVFAKRYANDAMFRLKTEAEAECAELVTRPPLEQNYRFYKLVELYEQLPFMPKGPVVAEEFRKACLKERRLPP